MACRILSSRRPCTTGWPESTPYWKERSAPGRTRDTGEPSCSPACPPTSPSNPPRGACDLGPRARGRALAEFVQPARDVQLDLQGLSSCQVVEVEEDLLDACRGEPVDIHGDLIPAAVGELTSFLRQF